MYTLSIVSSNSDTKEVNLDIGAPPPKMEPTEEQIKCFICCSPEVPVGLKGKGETSIFDSFCKLFNFPRSVFGKRRLFSPVGNWEFCDNCLLVIREVMTTLDQIQALRDHVEVVKLELQKQIISSHNFSQRSSSDTCGRSSMEKVRGLFTQCWSSCRVLIPRLPIATSETRDRDGASQALSESRDDDDWMDPSYEVDQDDEIEDSRPHDSIKNRKVFKKKRKMKMKDVSLNKSEHSEDELPFKCYYCPARFRTEKGRGGHTRIHDDEKPLWCKLCGIGIMTTRLLIQHLQRSHKSHDHSVCAFCDMDFKTQIDGVQYMCSLNGCEEKFSALWELRTHHLSKCAVNPRASSKGSSGGEATGSTEGHQCGICSVILLSLEDMNTHMSSNHGENAENPDQTCGVIELEVFDEGSVAFTNLEQQLIEAANEATKPDAIENAGENSSFQQSCSGEGIHADYLFVCSYCPKRFKSERARASHSIAHSNQKPYNCKICSTGFVEARWLQNHVARVHKITDKNSCPFCLFDFKAARDPTTRRYKCALDSCSEDFRNLSTLRSHHLEKCAGNSELDSEPLTCKKCGKITSGPHSMAVHRGFCKGAPPEQGPLRKQQRAKERIPRCSSKPSADLPFKCSLCPKYFATQDILTLHQLHHNEKLSSYNCNQCDKVVKTKQALRSHIATMHERNFKFICSQCGQGFQASSMLQRHIDYVHSTELRFTCEHCGLKFKRSHQLLYHRRRHTGELPYVCHICGKGYVNPSMFNSHLAIHKGGNFPCDLCAKSFISIAYLRYHKKYVHEGKLRRKKVETIIEAREEHEHIEQDFDDE